MTTPDPAIHPDPAATSAAAALGEQARALVALALPYRDALSQLDAVLAVRAELLTDPDNDRHSMATGTALLAVLADAGEIGTPYGKLAVGAGTVVAALVALQLAGCFAPESCPGAEQPRSGATCRRCVGLVQLEDETGLSGKAFAE